MMNIPENFQIYFTQGGAQMQFSAICYNLMTEHKAGNFLVTGAWSDAIAQEASKTCNVNIVEDNKSIGRSSVNVDSWIVL